MTTEILDFNSKLLQPTMREWLTYYVRHRTATGPIIVEFDPTTTCQMTCPECISGSLLNQGYISSERTLELIDEFKLVGVQGVIFIGGGEPLAHKCMPVPIRKCHDLGLAVGLTTNGLLIERYLSDIAECVSWTRVSVDAANQKTFSLFRPSQVVESFSRVIRGMDLLGRSKVGLLGYSFLLMERRNGSGFVTNIPELYEAARLARELGCDYFEYKPAVDADHNLIPLSDTSRRSLVEQILMMAGLATDTFKVLAPQSVQHLLDGVSVEQPKNYRTCPTLELRTVVTPSGVYPCPYKRGHQEVKLAETNMPFGDAWNSSDRRAKALAINPSTDCRFYCIRHDTNSLLLSLADAYDNGVNLLPYMLFQDSGDVFV